MKPSSTIVLLFVLSCMIWLWSCAGGSPSGQQAQADTEVQYRAVPGLIDSLAVSPETKYFYRYQYGSGGEGWDLKPQWLFANLAHLGIQPVEAWYAPPQGSLTGNSVYGPPPAPPVFVVGLAQESTEILDHHFDLAERPDSILIGTRIIHYIRVDSTKSGG